MVIKFIILVKGSLKIMLKKRRGWEGGGGVEEWFFFFIVEEIEKKIYKVSGEVRLVIFFDICRFVIGYCYRS